MLNVLTLDIIFALHVEARLGVDPIMLLPLLLHKLNIPLGQLLHHALTFELCRHPAAFLESIVLIVDDLQVYRSRRFECLI